MLEQVTQIVEAIKTLNLNIDSQSMVEIVGKIKPILWAYILRPYFDISVCAIIVLVGGTLAFKAWMRSKNMEDEKSTRKDDN